MYLVVVVVVRVTIIMHHACQCRAGPGQTREKKVKTCQVDCQLAHAAMQGRPPHKLGQYYHRLRHANRQPLVIDLPQHSTRIIRRIETTMGKYYCDYCDVFL